MEQCIDVGTTDSVAAFTSSPRLPSGIYSGFKNILSNISMAPGSTWHQTAAVVNRSTVITPQVLSVVVNNVQQSELVHTHCPLC